MAQNFTQKRKTLFIDAPFQKSFLFYTAGIALIVALIYYGANRYFFLKFYEKGQQIGLPDGHVFFKFIQEQQQTMNLIFIATSILSTCAIIGYGLYLSNRVAGPIYQVKEYLRKNTRGKQAEPLRFRTKDYFPELAKAVTDYVTKESRPS